MRRVTEGWPALKNGGAIYQKLLKTAVGGSLSRTAQDCGLCCLRLLLDIIKVKVSSRWLNLWICSSKEKSGLPTEIWESSAQTWLKALRLGEITEHVNTGVYGQEEGVRMKPGTWVSEVGVEEEPAQVTKQKQPAGQGVLESCPWWVSWSRAWSAHSHTVDSETGQGPRTDQGTRPDDSSQCDQDFEGVRWGVSCLEYV